MRITDKNMNQFFGDEEKAINVFFNGEENFEITRQHERCFHAVNLNLNYDMMIKNLGFIYNDEIEEKASLFDNVLTFLKNVVMVDNIETLYSKHFYDIEWNMFMEYDFNKGDMRYYRDHFIHQIRNAYLGYILIWDLGLKDIIHSALLRYPEKNAAEYINICFSYQNDTEKSSKTLEDFSIRLFHVSALH